MLKLMSDDLFVAELRERTKRYLGEKQGEKSLLYEIAAHHCEQLARAIERLAEMEKSEPKMKEVDLEEAMRWSINRLNRGLKNVFFDQNDAENHMFHYVRGDGLYMNSNSLALTMKLFNTTYLIPEDE